MHMPIVIIHYHLDAGGVTEVITRASEAMMEAGIPHLILAGGTHAAMCSGKFVRHIQGLSYRDLAVDPDATSLLGEIRETVAQTFGSAPVTWCFHNHSLGKNPLIPEIIKLLALSHERIVLHIHDLIENGRPENLSRVLDITHFYPQNPRIHYVFLNSRDHRIFVDAGLPSDRAHILPNPTPARKVTGQTPVPQPHPMVFYPVRGIRRKNLGEVALFSILAPTGTRFAISRAPTDGTSRKHHDDWKFQVEHHSLPVDFDVTDHLIPPGGRDATFESWCSQSTHWITTSIAEGFGLAYFDATASGKPFIGRKLENIADQLPQSTDSRFYDHLLIPASWIDQSRLKCDVSKRINKLSNAWNRQFDPQTIDSIMEHLDKSGYFDFGNLPEDFQLDVLIQTLDEKNQSEILIQQNGRRQSAKNWLLKQLSPEPTSESTETCHLVTPAGWLSRMLQIFRILEDAPATQPEWLDAQLILDPFLTVEQFHFLQCP